MPRKSKHSCRSRDLKKSYLLLLVCSFDFLQQVGVKLSKRKRTYTKSVQRRESFVKGKVDSKDIDINQKSLAGPNQSSSSCKR